LLTSFKEYAIIISYEQSGSNEHTYGFPLLLDQRHAVSDAPLQQKAKSQCYDKIIRMTWIPKSHPDRDQHNPKNIKRYHFPEKLKLGTLHRFIGTQDHFDWANVEPIHYEDGAAKGASGKILIGDNDGARNFVFRYFHIEPGGHSTLNDHHIHDHGVMILHGRALVTLEDGQYEVGPHDIIYIPPWEHHSLTALGDEPLGFLCVIPNKELLVKQTS
jgi:quercetin dioxygenase-like cupin family protein